MTPAEISPGVAIAVATAAILIGALVVIFAICLAVVGTEDPLPPSREDGPHA
jgi:hypothetical protein